MGPENESNLVDVDKFNKCLNEFVDYVNENQKEPRAQGEKISFHSGFLEEEEGHKRKLYEKAGLGVEYRDSLKGATVDEIKNRFLKIVDDKDNNLLYPEKHGKGKGEKADIRKHLEEPESEELLERIFKEPSENDEQLCKEAIKLWGSRYSIIAFTFFLKDINSYVPVKPKDFKPCLEYLGADTSCVKSFSWGNYQKFLDILKNVQDLLNASGRFSEKVELIDADSFVWMIRKVVKDSKAMSIASEVSEGGKKDMIGRNILYYGVPGAGKSFKVDQEIKKDDPNFERTERVVFHPEYTYSDFVGQILPQVVETEGKKTNDISYDFMPGPFTRILKAAYADKKHMYYLVVEEINRGNAPAIFGDLFQLLDRKNGVSEYRITNSDIAKVVYKDENQKIELPNNLTIYATMNTSDQNVFTLDTAFQRRWEMKLVENNFDVEDHGNDVIAGSSITWGKFAEVINDKILSSNDTLLSSEDKRLGAFFVTKEEVEDKDKFCQKVFKYLWDDAFKLNRYDVFKTDFKSLEDVIKKCKGNEDPVKAIFNDEVYGKMIGQNKNDNKEDTSGNNEEDERS